MRDTDRISELEHSGKLLVTRFSRSKARVRLTNPQTRSWVAFYPESGIIVRNNVTQSLGGLDRALKLIGVRAVA